MGSVTSNERILIFNDVIKNWYLLDVVKRWLDIIIINDVIYDKIKLYW